MPRMDKLNKKKIKMINKELRHWKIMDIKYKKLNDSIRCCQDIESQWYQNSMVKAEIRVVNRLVIYYHCLIICKVQEQAIIRLIMTMQTKEQSIEIKPINRRNLKRSKPGDDNIENERMQSNRNKRQILQRGSMIVPNLSEKKEEEESKKTIKDYFCNIGFTNVNGKELVSQISILKFIGLKERVFVKKLKARTQVKIDELQSIAEHFNSKQETKHPFLSTIEADILTQNKDQSEEIKGSIIINSPSICTIKWNTNVEDNQ
ncbi:hypothetical protein RFI_30824 [Reticulomyxa filosa]|uniref:Uncharacterized protein n=1 Tax=Reticulomyxa filosa TaxID=46433 RepID=X6LY72_RETFI|nr:hypothetical protein RFI_30824 [Reticulomyxa filosa]|eukprot:ETO06569.1 hypothetical protein RFI_30824 [Reticulomyxa filosa]